MGSKGQEQFVLKWNNFPSNIVSAFEDLKMEEDFVDVTLSCQGKFIKAHKVILSACSPYFKAAFRTSPCNHPIVILKDAKYSDLESLLKYVYQGQVTISQDDLHSFLKTADDLQIKGLAETSSILSSSSDPSETSSTLHEESSIKGLSGSVSFKEQVSFPSTVRPKVSPLKIPLIPLKRRAIFDNNNYQHFESSYSPPISVSQGQISLPSSSSSSSSMMMMMRHNPISFSQNSISKRSKTLSNHHYSESTSTASPGSPRTELPEDESDREILDTSVSTSVSNSILDYGSEIYKSKEIDSECETLDLSLHHPTRPRRLPEEKCGSHISEGVLEAALTASDSGNINSIARKDVKTPEIRQASDYSSPTHPRNKWRCMQPRLCNYCWKTFSNSFNLKQHIVNVHIQSVGISCSLCEKIVKNKWYLRKHLVTAHGAPLKRSKGVSDGKEEDKHESSSPLAASSSASAVTSSSSKPPVVEVN